MVEGGLAGHGGAAENWRALPKWFLGAGGLVRAFDCRKSNRWLTHFGYEPCFPLRYLTWLGRLTGVCFAKVASGLRSMMTTSALLLPVATRAYRMSGVMRIE